MIMRRRTSNVCRYLILLIITVATIVTSHFIYYHECVNAYENDG